jgi:hypothetical protein
MALVAFISAFILVIIVPTIIIQVIKYRIRFGPEIKIHVENDIERTLNEAVADEKFESSLQRTIVRKRQTAATNTIRSPEEVDYQISPRRDRGFWKPDIPGIIHDQDQSPDW